MVEERPPIAPTNANKVEVSRQAMLENAVVQTMGSVPDCSEPVHDRARQNEMAEGESVLAPLQVSDLQRRMVVQKQSASRPKTAQRSAAVEKCSQSPLALYRWTGL